ncbi:MAG TPA: zinc-dependent metalloprotease, partial [Candidatus Eremiobacteraceae bacterium]|nr:zinc-dependent metalloprotease [Candidatus Eremiobacteraceae bacterium]
NASANGTESYDQFIKDAQLQSGLFPIITKADKTYLAIAANQLDKQFIETSVPSTGLGGFGPAPGEPYVAPARMIEFSKIGGRIIIFWPNTNFIAPPGSPQSQSIAASFPSSVIAAEPIVAADASGTFVISASAFLGDVADLSASFRQQIDNPSHGYRLDPSRSFFTKAAAFPGNDVLEVAQTWASDDPNLIDNAPDPRSISVRMEYNLIQPPSDNYMPRIADDRVGYFEVPFLDFGTDQTYARQTFYLSRWNFAPATPGTPSAATHPLVFTISKDVPVEYRQTVRDALLAWNTAFKRVGILNAVNVQDQPDDPSWDPEDMRHNMVRWIDTSAPQYGAEALIVNDPRTGEEINVGINVDAVVGTGANSLYTYLVAPLRGLPDDPAARRRFVLESLRATVLHESGHDMGFQHNFIGSTAYTASQLQSKSFTDANGIASSVMEYASVNVWPKGTPQGDYSQVAIGPYDYHAIEYGYGYVPNARTPRDELAALHRIASGWNDPRFRFESDEDVSFGNGHAIDPRNQQFDLTNDTLRWCEVEMSGEHALMDAVNRRFPSFERPNDDAREAFAVPLRQYSRCTIMAARYIGGEYLSRNRAGDSNPAPPLSFVPRSQEVRAWQQMDRFLFSDAAWRFNPSVLTRLTYTEASLLSGGSWAYNPADRHDVPVVEVAATAQDNAFNEMFAPLTLQRIDELSTKYGQGRTMNLADLFDWAQTSVFGDIARGRAGSDGVVLRNLQSRYARRLAGLWVKPRAGTPDDARSLAHAKLVALQHDARSALGRSGLDELAIAHLEALDAIAAQALSAQATTTP